MTWSTANHEVIPNQEFLLPDETMHPYLWAFLESDGEFFRDSIDGYRQYRQHLATAIEKFSGRSYKGKSPTAEVQAQRLRTWKVLFERAGLFTVNNDAVIEVSPFGHAVRDLFNDLSTRVAGANDHLSKWATSVLGRYPLLNPLEGPEGGDGSYPEDCDLLPFRAMWYAARQLNDGLHWQEMNRGLMLIHYQNEIDGVITKIKDARAAGGDVYFDDPSRWLGSDVAVDDGSQTRRRITPWLTRASFGGLLAEDDEETGLWKLRPERIALIDEALQENITIPTEARENRQRFLEWLSHPIAQKVNEDIGPQEAEAVQRVVESARKYGKSKIICLSGLPGTGKSRLAKLVSQNLTGGDEYRSAEIQFHESTSYEDFVEGFIPRPDGSGFRLVDKTLRMICKRAMADPRDRDYVILIEEFTRANTHAVLGELLTYIEHRERRFRYSLSQDETSIPKNLTVIATMNPRDRSATQLDSAVRRRLHYIDVSPSPAALKTMLEDKLSPQLLASLLEWYNNWYMKLPFGHGVFAEVTDDNSLKEIWEGTCLRLLEDALGDVDEIYADAVKGFPC